MRPIMTNQLFRPAVFLLLVVFAFSSAAGEPPAGTVRTEWTPPTETGVGWDSGDYAYDDSGNIVSIGRDKFAYDGVNRLKAGSVNAHGVVTSQSFGYDRYGNLLGIATTIANGSDFPTADGVTFSVSAATNRLDSVCHPTRGCETWTYDDDTGNLTRNQKRIGGALVYDVAYDWDATGAMTELDSGNAHERYVYDANDERVVMVSLDGDDEVIRRWTWRDGTNKVVREAVEHVGTDRWSEPRDYVYRNGSLLAAFESSTATVAERHYHVDHLGTPRLITDAGRHKLAIEVYLPFGERAPGGEAAYIGFSDRMRFTGHERDGDGSPYRPMLDYMHARYYTPEWGRLLSVDPGGFYRERPQSWNRYAYASNNPINRFDPDGREDKRSTQDKAILEDFDTLAMTGEAVSRTNLGASLLSQRTEQGLIVTDLGGGDYGAEGPYTSGQSNHVDFPLQKTGETITSPSGEAVAATVHTHPGTGFLMSATGTKVQTLRSGASNADRNLAEVTGAPAFVIQPNEAIIRVDPNTKKQERVLTDPELSDYLKRAEEARKLKEAAAQVTIPPIR